MAKEEQEASIRHHLYRLRYLARVHSISEIIERVDKLDEALKKLEVKAKEQGKEISPNLG